MEVFFLVNEGEDTIDTRAAVRGSGALVSMDLWSGEVRTLACTQKEDMLSFALKLKRRESILILIDTDAENNAPEEEIKEYIQPEFKLISDDTQNFVKTYKAVIHTAKKNNIYISFKAEEMAECFVNSKFAGFSLWNDHEFYLSPYLEDGENIIELKITGSAVNRYTDYTKEYGLM